MRRFHNAICLACFFSATSLFGESVVDELSSEDCIVALNWESVGGSFAASEGPCRRLSFDSGFPLDGFYAVDVVVSNLTSEAGSVGLGLRIGDAVLPREGSAVLDAQEEAVRRFALPWAKEGHASFVVDWVESEPQDRRIAIRSVRIVRLDDQEALAASWLASDESGADYDHDGLSNAEEARLGTDPFVRDTDGDGLQDGDEVSRFHLDPLEPVATRPLVWHVFRSLGEGGYGNDSIAYYVHGGNKNVTDVIRAAPDNDSVAHYEYAPFGAVKSSTGNRALDNPFRFSSEYHDDTLGLVYYNYRHYEPGSGRWLSRDPIGEEGGVCLYLFCSNSAIFSYDVFGASVVDLLICMGDCIEDNDPLDKVWEKIVGEMMAGVIPKRCVANIFEHLANSGFVDPRIAVEIKKTLKVWKVSRMTTMPSSFALLLKNIPAKHFLRGMGASLSYFWTAYGLYMIQVESACAGACCGASAYDPKIGIYLLLDVNSLVEGFKQGIHNDSDNF